LPGYTPEDHRLRVTAIGSTDDRGNKNEPCALEVYTDGVKNITLSAEEALIEGARRRAEAENTTLNNVFREWLARYAGPRQLSADDVRRVAMAASHFRVGRRFTRDERNER
jgi:hypothetical protein